MPGSVQERHFAGKVHAFNAGYDRVKDLDFEIVGNLDADVSFDPNHFEFLMGKMGENPQLGLAGAPFREGSYQYDYRYTNIENVWGGCQLFRRECFECDRRICAAEGRLHRSRGSSLSRRMKGWKTRTFTEKSLYPPSPDGYASALQGTLKARFKFGAKDYSVGNHPLWGVIQIVATRCGSVP